MKKFLLTTLIFAVTSLVMRASLQHQTVNITFSEDDFELSEHDGVLHIIPADLFAWYPEGNVPGLPKISADFTISGKVENVIKITHRFTKRLIRSNVVMAQTPGVDPTGSAIQQTRAEEPTYDPNKVYPEKNFDFVQTGDVSDDDDEENPAIMTKFYCSSCPFVYDAAKKELYFIDSIEVDLQLDFDDTELTETLNTPATAASANEQIDLMGRQVTNPQSGHFYIQNGKKIIW